MEEICKVSGGKKMETIYKEIDINKIKLNTYNPNEMEDDNLQHLKEEIQRIGLVQPIIVRPDGEEFIVIDGEHRFKICQENKLKTIPCMIADVDENTAKTLTVNLNRIRGSNNYLKYANLLYELDVDLSSDEIMKNLKVSETELAGLKLVTKLPDSKVKKAKHRYIDCPKCNFGIKL